MISFLRSQRARRRMCAAGLQAFAMLLAVANGSAPASATPDLKPNHAWGGCSLPSTLRTQLNNAIKATASSKFASVAVDFIVVHTIALDNNGQPLTAAAGGGHSGVILCTFKGGTSAATPTLETTAIPNAANHPASTNIDILSNQQQSVLQYKLNDGSLAGKVEKRVCQTTDGNTDCFRVFKP